jgi:hypothetical protein
MNAPRAFFQFIVRFDPCSTTLVTNRHQSRRVVQSARSRCDSFEEQRGSGDCRSYLRLNVRHVGCLTPRYRGDDGGRHNAAGDRDRHGRRLAWARSLVLTKALSCRCPLTAQSGTSRGSVKFGIRDGVSEAFAVMRLPSQKRNFPNIFATVPSRNRM